MSGLAGKSETLAVKVADAPSDEVMVNTATAVSGASRSAAICKFIIGL